MVRILLCPLLIGIGCVMAGVFGILHNQISYTVSPDYFHEFKYLQFDLDPALPGRLGAAIVGWNSSWWMGIFIGMLIVPFGCLIPGTKPFVFGVVRSYVAVSLTAFIIGLTALMIAYLSIRPETVGEIVRFGHPITHPFEFALAGTMHNFSYLGGVLGIITGIIWIARERSAATLERNR